MITLPNIFSLFRLIAAFVFLFFSIRGQWNIAFPIFVSAAVTDFIDGGIARLLKQRTQLGAFLDPTADKLLMFFSFVTLTLHQFIPLFLTLLIIARDLLIVFGVIFLRSRQKKLVYRPTYLSKVTTVFQMTTVVCALLQTQNVHFLLPLIHFASKIKVSVLWITAGLTFSTGIQYWGVGWRILHEKNQTDRQ